MIGVNRNVSVTSIESDISLRSLTASAAVNKIFSISCFPQLSSEVSCDDSISIVCYLSMMFSACPQTARSLWISEFCR
jgi:hypothetical protein